MNWYKRAQVSKKLLNRIENKKQFYLKRGISPEQISWVTNMSVRLKDVSYFDWLIQQTINGSANIETGEDDKKIFSVLSRYKELKLKKKLSPQQSNINNYPTFPKLHELVSSFEQQQQEDILSKVRNLNGAQVIFSEGVVSVIRVDRAEAGEKLFSSTGWCVRHKNTFNSYRPPFFMFTVYNKPYALYNESTGEFKDEHDDSMTFNKTFILLNALKWLLKNGILNPKSEQFEHKVIYETVRNSEKLNEACEKGDLEEIQRILSKNLKYATLIEDYHLTPEILDLVKSLFMQKYEEEKKDIYEIVEFYETIPKYLDINNFPLKERDKEIVLEQLSQLSFYNFKNLPSVLRKDKDVQNALKSILRRIIAENPTTFQVLRLYEFDILVNDPTFEEFLRQTWLSCASKPGNLHLFSENLEEVPEHLRDDPELLQNIKRAFIEEIENDPTRYIQTDLPERIKEDPEVLMILKKKWIYFLKQEPRNFELGSFPIALRNDPDIFKALKAGYMEKIRKDPLYYNNSFFPVYFQEDPDILKIVRQSWLSYIKNAQSFTDMGYCNEIPFFLKDDMEIKKEIKNKWIELIQVKIKSMQSNQINVSLMKIYSLLLENIPDFLKDDPDIVNLLKDKQAHNKNWFKRAQTANIKLWNDCFDAHGGEVFCRIIAEEEDTGNIIGYIDYSIYEDEIDIKMVEVLEPYRRKGIGTKMIEFLKNENPGMKIHTELMTNLGFPFVQNLKERKIL